MPIPSSHQIPARTTAKESAFQQLQQWIIDGTLRPGEKLNDVELAEALGVSRTPIRESLQLLEMQGFVKMFPGKATQVTDVDQEDIYDLLPPLAALQALSAELAIPNVTEALLNQLKKTNDAFAEAVRGHDYFQALKIDEQFHQLIVDAANNPYISQMLALLQAHVRRLFFHNSIILTEQSIAEHAQVIHLLKTKERQKITTVMRENWLRAIEEFQSLKEKSPQTIKNC